MDKAATVDEFLSRLPDEQSRVLENLRKTVKSAAPGAVEVISYGVPMRKLDGRGLVAFGAAKGAANFYVMSVATTNSHKKELEAYDTEKSTIHFPLDKPLPTALLKKLVKVRIEENRLRVKGK